MLLPGDHGEVLEILTLKVTGILISGKLKLRMT